MTEQTPIRERILKALEEPLPKNESDQIDPDNFDPWFDIFPNIYGSYASESDYLFIGVLEAVRDKKTFDFIEEKGFAAELVLYIFAGHDLIEYGTSPRGGWVNPAIADLWDALIQKWQSYADAVWGDDEND